MTGPHDTESSLEDIDRKLRELQHELARVFERPDPVGAGSFAGPATAPPPSPTSQSPAVPPTVTSPPPASVPSPGGAPALSRPLALGVQAPPQPTPASANDHPQAVAAPPADAGRMAEEAASRVADMGRQIDALQRLCEDLERTVRALAGQHAGAAPAPAPAAAPAPDAAAVPPSPAPDPSQLDPQRAFDGQVIVNAGPFLDIGTLGAFEHALAAVPQVQDVYVRSFEGNRALIDVRLGGHVHLVDEMRRALPFSFGVVEVGHKLLTINVDTPPPGRPDSVAPEGEEVSP